MTTERPVRLVGPVLKAGPAAEAVITAIRTENPDVRVLDRGSYLRVLAPEPCHVSRAAIERALDAPFRLPGDLEALMVSFKGRLRLDDQEAVWHLSGGPS